MTQETGKGPAGRELPQEKVKEQEGPGGRAESHGGRDTEIGLGGFGLSFLDAGPAPERIFPAGGGLSLGGQLPPGPLYLGEDPIPLPGDGLAGLLGPGLLGGDFLPKLPLPPALLIAPAACAEHEEDEAQQRRKGR